VAENRARVARALGFRALLTPSQVHGAAVAWVDGPLDAPPETDALATDRPGLLLGVLGADCPGVLVVDPARRAFAVAHSGWRGVVAGVVPAAVHALVARGSDPGRLLAGVGPGISRRRYEVGPDVADRLARSVPGGERAIEGGAGDRRHVDLKRLIQRQLVEAGLPEDHVACLDRCTYEEAEVLFSHRRDGPQSGRHALVAGFPA
jgi:YfiH family protein